MEILTFTDDGIPDQLYGKSKRRGLEFSSPAAGEIRGISFRL